MTGAAGTSGGDRKGPVKTACCRLAGVGVNALTSFFISGLVVDDVVIRRGETASTPRGCGDVVDNVAGGCKCAHGKSQVQEVQGAKVAVRRACGVHLCSA